MMNDEEKNETEATPEPDEAQEPEAEAPVEEPAAEEAEESPAAEEAEETPAAEEAEETPAAAEPAGDADEAGAEPLTPKRQRKLERSRHGGEARPPRSAAERAAERAQARGAKAAERRRSRARARSKHQGGEGTPTADRSPGSKKVRLGTVVSSKADKTITVRVEVVRRHPVYEKVIRRSATIHAHDERNEANAGDVVRVIESRPLSRSKRWRLVEVLEKAR
jgi:small subunit ribosomal protein S17